MCFPSIPSGTWFFSSKTLVYVNVFQRTYGWSSQAAYTYMCTRILEPCLTPSLEGLESHRSRKRNKEVCRAIGRKQACAGSGPSKDKKPRKSE